MSVENWLGRLAPATAKSRRIWFNAFMKWLRENGGRFKDMTPDELVEYQKGCVGDERFEVLDMVQNYILSLNGRSLNTKKNYYATIRSFFAHNRAELPRDRSFIMRGDKPKENGSLDVGHIRDLAVSSKPVYRAIFLSMFQAGLDLDGFEYWNLNGWEGLRRQLQGDPKLVRIDLPGRKKFKNEKPFYTFIGGDAIEAIRGYLRDRPAEMKVYEHPRTEKSYRRVLVEERSNSVIFNNQYGT